MDGPSTPRAIVPTLRLHLLGGFRALVGDGPVPAAAWRLRKAQSLVKLLALATGHRLPRDVVLDALWPDLNPAAAANNLRVALHAARRALAPVAIAARVDVLLLSPDAPAWIDVAAFESAAAAARRDRDPAAAAAAIEVYTGDLLPEDAYEDWAAGPREALRAEYLGLLGELASREEARGERAAAIAALERLVAADPVREAAHRELMRLYAETGQRGLGLRQYERLLAALERELDAEPEAATRALFRSVVAGDLAPALPPPPPEGDRPPGNLPLALTRLVGRGRELEALRGLLDGTRLLTLSGTGGMGKSRLALEVARAVAGEYPDGAWLVELAPLSEAALVAGAVAGALGIPEQPGRQPLDILVAWLRGRTGLLLVLDNCEHLVDACARLVEAVLLSCPGVRVLVTSRRPLGTGGEITWPVPPLSLPDGAGGGDIERLRASEAAQLFLVRATAARPGFALTPEDARAVIEICRRLDGIPLALELAAARVRALGMAELATRLGAGLGLLSETGGGRPVRQRTLRATLGWSHDQLGEPGRALFRRLAVFAGGWTLAAAEAIGAADDPGEGVALDGLVELVDHSLVQTVAGDGGTVRYRLLEPVRQYAAERLAAAGDGPVAVLRHQDWYAALAERGARALLGGPDQVAWLARLETEHDNMRAALGWCLVHDPAAGLRLSADLGRFWRVRGHADEGRRWLAATLARVPAGGATHAKARLELGMLLDSLGQREAARAEFEAGLAIARALGDRSLTARGLRQLGHALHGLGQSRQGEPMLAEALTMARESGDRREVGETLYHLAELAEYGGDLRRAGRLLDQSLVEARAAGDRWLLALVLENLASVAVLRGDPDRARALAEEGLALARVLAAPQLETHLLYRLGQAAAWRGDATRAAAAYEASLAQARRNGDEGQVAWTLVSLGRLARCSGDASRAAALVREGMPFLLQEGDPWALSVALYVLGLAALDGGDLETARASLQQSLESCHDLQSRLGLAEGLEGLAAVAVRMGQAARAARLLGMAGALREAMGAPLPPAERPGIEATVAAALTALGEVGLAAALAEGWAMPPAATIAEALGDGDIRQTGPVGASRA